MIGSFRFWEFWSLGAHCPLECGVYSQAFILHSPIVHTVCEQLGWVIADLFRYTLSLHNKRIFAAKYKLHLPSEQELVAN